MTAERLCPAGGVSGGPTLCSYRARAGRAAPPTSQNPRHADAVHPPQRAQYERDGYLLINGQFDSQETAFLRDAIGRMSQTAVHLVDHVIPHVPVRQWVLSLPIPLRVLLAAQPELVTPVLQVVQRLVTRHLLDAAGLKADEGQGGAVTLIQRFGSAANLNIHLHCLVLDGVYRRAADGSPAFIEAASPTDDELHALLQSVIERRGW